MSNAKCTCRSFEGFGRRSRAALQGAAGCMPAEPPLWLSPVLGQPLYLWVLLCWLTATVVYIVVDAFSIVVGAHKAPITT